MGIKLLGIDCDGTLTDSGVYVMSYCNSPTEMLKFNRRDGYGISLLRQNKIQCLIISGESSNALETRCSKLEIPCALGVKDKYVYLNKYLVELGISWSDFGYIGDDVNDLEVVKHSGFSACPSDAEEEIKRVVSYVCKREGGKACVREVIDRILGKPEELRRQEIQSNTRFQTIALMKEKYIGQTGILVGTGPSADFLSEAIRLNPKSVLIGINRAACLNDRFDFVFIDHHTGLKLAAPYMRGIGYVLMPMFSRNEINTDSVEARKYASKILLYSWVYEDEGILTAPSYSLNDIHLFIQWGNAQSAVHFAKKIGLSRLIILGCDGGEVDGRMFAAKIEPMFRRAGEKKMEKKEEKYEETRAKMEWIASKVGIEIKFGV